MFPFFSFLFFSSPPPLGADFTFLTCTHPFYFVFCSFLFQAKKIREGIVSVVYLYCTPLLTPPSPPPKRKNPSLFFFTNNQERKEKGKLPNNWLTLTYTSLFLFIYLKYSMDTIYIYSTPRATLSQLVRRKHQATSLPPVPTWSQIQHHHGAT